MCEEMYSEYHVLQYCISTTVESVDRRLVHMDFAHSSQRSMRYMWLLKNHPPKCRELHNRRCTPYCTTTQRLGSKTCPHHFCRCKLALNVIPSDTKSTRLSDTTRLCPVTINEKCWVGLDSGTTQGSGHTNYVLKTECYHLLPFAKGIRRPF